MAYGSAMTSESTESGAIFRKAFWPLFGTIFPVIALIVGVFHVMPKRLSQVEFVQVAELPYFLIGTALFAALVSAVSMVMTSVQVTSEGIRSTTLIGASRVIPWTEMAFIYKNRFLLSSQIYIVCNDGFVSSFTLEVWDRSSFLRLVNEYIKKNGIKSVPEVIY